jgi:alkylation response protein AidB-like acyl-CoA dehydrogenase
MPADMAMKVEAARLMVYSAAARAERGEPNLGFISAASKCVASDVAMEVTADAPCSCSAVPATPWTSRWSR